MTLQAAINDIRDSIVIDGYSDDLVAEIAEDYELNPILLERKFSECYGVSVADWVAPTLVSERDLESLRPAAEKWYNEQFRGSGVEIGSTFKRGDRAGFVVAITTNAVYYIDTLNENRMVLKFSNRRSRAAWVAKNL